MLLAADSRVPALALGRHLEHLKQSTSKCPRLPSRESFHKRRRRGIFLELEVRAAQFDAESLEEEVGCLAERFSVLLGAERPASLHLNQGRGNNEEKTKKLIWIYRMKLHRYQEFDKN